MVGMINLASLLFQTEMFTMNSLGTMLSSVRSANGQWLVWLWINTLLLQGLL